MMKRALILAVVFEAFLGLLLLYERLWAHFNGHFIFIDYFGFVTHLPGIFVYFTLDRLLVLGDHSIALWLFYLCLVVTNVVCGAVFIACVLYLKSRFSWKVAAAYLSVPLAAGLLGASVSWRIISEAQQAGWDYDRGNETRSSFGHCSAMASFYEDLVYDMWFGGAPPPRGLRFRLEAATIAGVDYALRGLLLASVPVGLYALACRLRKRVGRGGVGSPVPLPGRTTARTTARMKPETKRILSDPALLDAREAHFARLEALFAGSEIERAFHLNGRGGSGKADLYGEPERWVEEALDDLAANVDALRDEAVFRPLVVGPNPYGVHFIDRMFGAEVFELHEKDNWQARPLETPVGGLVPPDLKRDETWALARRGAGAFLDAGVTVPLFAMPTIASALNIAMNLHGEKLLVAMMEDRPGAHRDLRTINGLLCELHRWYLGRIPRAQLQAVAAAGRTQPPGHGQLCGCSTHLLSPELYRDFIAPLDEELLTVHPRGGMIHLCGSHTQHIPVWRTMRPLRAVQLNDRAAEDLEVYFTRLRDDQVLYVNPCEGMPVERIIEITGGRRVVIVADAKGSEPATP
ncbi:MAG: uroporphyrinogen decarboxylase/cobalamine-independent methonine synthase family protein [Planctomycetota bacterium]|jgi:hypothetical protein